MTSNNILILLLLLLINFHKRINAQDNEDDCVCVPYYQCEDGKVITTGEGIFDIRIKTCSGIEVCCQLPGDEDEANNNKPPPVDPLPQPTTDPIPSSLPPIDNNQPTPSNGPSLPQIIGDDGCGRRRQPGDGSNIDNSLRITGLLGYPEETFYGEAPWQVRLLFLNNGQINDTFLMCGGSLITNNVVITAAHCVDKLNTDNLLIRAGDWNIQQQFEPLPVQDSRAAKIILHPEYNSRNLANDVALIGLQTPIKITQTVDVVCAPDPLNPVNTSACLATGWGKNDLTRYGNYQDTLRKVILPLMEKEECVKRLRKTKLGKYFRLLPGFLCAGGVQDNDTCEGDGGGPLYCPLELDPNRYAIIGITSWGIDCGKGNPAVFVDINYYMPWIKQQLG